MNQDFVLEQIKSFRNLIDIAILIRAKGYFPSTNHFNTVLEMLLYEVQELVEKTCVIRDDKDTGD